MPSSCHTFLASPLNVDKKVISTIQPIHPRFPLDRRGEDPKASLEAVAKREIPAPARNRTPNMQPVARPFICIGPTRTGFKMHTTFIESVLRFQI
jgi:hypothetical protein